MNGQYAIKGYLYQSLLALLESFKTDWETVCVEPNISQTYLKAFIIPIPPYEEQKRIVDIIKESLEKCGLIEAQITENKKTADSLLNVVLKETFEN